MARDAVFTIDEDLQKVVDFRYKTLVETFGKKVADEIINGDDSEEIDADIQEILDAEVAVYSE